MKYLIPIFITLLISNCKNRTVIKEVLPTKEERPDTEEYEKKNKQRMRDQFYGSSNSEITTEIEIVKIKETIDIAEPSDSDKKDQMSREEYAEAFELIKTKDNKK